MKIKGVLEEQKEDGFTAHIPFLSGCISQGETREEAKNIKEAIELYLETGTAETIQYKDELVIVAV